MCDIFCNYWKIPTFRQTFVVIGLVSMMLTTGMCVGTATVMMPQLQETGDILVSDNMASWIYSVQGFAAVPAVLTLPYLNQWTGYRITLVVYCLPLIVSYLMQYFASTAVHLLLAAMLQGITFGGNLSIGIMAITEYSEPRLRSMFLLMKSAAYFWGIWIANIIGSFFNWRYIPLMALIPAIFPFISCYFWPNGPYWLASKGRLEECEKSFFWLRGPGKNSEELASIIKAQTLKQETMKSDNIVAVIKNVKLRHFYMPLSVNVVLYCLYYFSGKLVFAVYSLIIIKDITKDESFSAYIGMLIIDGVTVLGMYIGSYVSIKVRRRSMLLATTAFTIFFLYILSIYLCLVKYEVILQNKFLTLCLLVIYSFAVSWGPMVLCTSFTSEITPMRFKPVIISAGSAIAQILHTTSLKLAPIMFSNTGLHGTFGIYGTLTLISWLYLYKYLPETSNKTLQELETHFVIKKSQLEYTDNELEKDAMLSPRNFQNCEIKSPGSCMLRIK